jgi:hypothetical protein
MGRRMSCCVERENGAAPGSGGGGDAAGTLVEIDFREDPSVPIVNGAITIDGHPFVGANVANAAVFEQNATGLRIAQSNGAAAAITTAARTGPEVYLELSTLPDWDSARALIIELFVVAYTAGPASNNDGLRTGVFKAINLPVPTVVAAAVWCGFRRTPAGNLKAIYSGGQAVAGTALDTDLTGVANSLCYKVETTGAASSCMETGIGNYAAGQWPNFQYVVFGATAPNAPMMSDQAQLLIGGVWAASGAPTLDFTVERMRVRQ